MLEMFYECILVTVAQLYKFIKTHCTVHLKWVYLVGYKFHLKNLIKRERKRQRKEHRQTQRETDLEERNWTDEASEEFHDEEEQKNEVEAKRGHESRKVCFVLFQMEEETVLHAVGSDPKKRKGAALIRVQMREGRITEVISLHHQKTMN